MKKKRIERFISLILIVFAAFSGAALLSVLPDKADTAAQGPAKSEETVETIMTEEDLPAAAAKESVLLLIGIEPETRRIDFLMLVRVDPAEKTIRALQIPPEGVSADARSANRLCTMVSGLTGIGIDAYISMDTQGFAKAVDLIGGISPDFPSAFEADGEAYPQGKTTLNGETAAKLMCAEIGSEDGFDTFSMQELLLRETLGRIRSEFSLVRAATLAGAVYPHVGTDLRFSEILSLVRAGMGINGENVIVTRFEGK